VFFSQLSAFDCDNFGRAVAIAIVEQQAAVVVEQAVVVVVHASNVSISVVGHRGRRAGTGSARWLQRVVRRFFLNFCLIETCFR